MVRSRPASASRCNGKADGGSPTSSIASTREPASPARQRRQQRPGSGGSSSSSQGSSEWAEDGRRPQEIDFFVPLRAPTAASTGNLTPMSDREEAAAFGLGNSFQNCEGQASGTNFVPKTLEELRPSYITEHLRFHGALNADAEVISVAPSMQTMEGLSGYSGDTSDSVRGQEAEGVIKQLELQYEPAGSGPASVVLKRFDMDTLGWFQDVVKPFRCAIFCCGGCCVSSCNRHSCFVPGYSYCCVRADQARYSFPLRNWAPEETFRPEFEFYTELHSLVRKRCPRFNMPKVFLTAFEDNGDTDCCTLRFCIFGKHSGSHGMLLLEDLSESGWFPCNDLAVYGPGAVPMQCSFAYKAGIEAKLASLPPARELLETLVLSLAELHAGFWRDVDLPQVNRGRMNFYQCFPWAGAGFPEYWNENRSAQAMAPDNLRNIFNDELSLFAAFDESAKPYLKELIKMGKAESQFSTKAVRDLVEYLIKERESLYARVHKEMDWRQTCVRGDAHAGNTWFRRASNGSLEASHFDFSGFTLGNVAAELLYALHHSRVHVIGWHAPGCEFDFEWEVSVLRRYHQRLTELGVHDLPFSQLFADYRACSLHLALWFMRHRSDRSEPTKRAKFVQADVGDSCGSKRVMVDREFVLKQKPSEQVRFQHPLLSHLGHWVDTLHVVLERACCCCQYEREQGGMAE